MIETWMQRYLRYALFSWLASVGISHLDFATQAKERKKLENLILIACERGLIEDVSAVCDTGVAFERD